MRKVQLIVDDINATATELASAYEASLEPFSPLFYTLVDQFPGEFDKYRLDEIVVGAIAPLVRRMVANWNPLREPTAFVSTFRAWQRALRVSSNEDKPPPAVDNYSSPAVTTTLVGVYVSSDSHF
jgi:tuftelin-interacting protein 11